MLKRDPDGARAGDDALALQQRLALGRDEQPGEDPGERRLARPVVTGHDDALAAAAASRSTPSRARRAHGVPLA